jgi:hypothetical protein
MGRDHSQQAASEGDLERAAPHALAWVPVSFAPRPCPLSPASNFRLPPPPPQILPVANLDGRLLWEGGDLCRRKTASQVDLNRNWGQSWHQQASLPPGMKTKVAGRAAARLSIRGREGRGGGEGSSIPFNQPSVPFFPLPFPSLRPPSQMSMAARCPSASPRPAS